MHLQKNKYKSIKNKNHTEHLHANTSFAHSIILFFGWQVWNLKMVLGNWGIKAFPPLSKGEVFTHTMHTIWDEHNSSALSVETIWMQKLHLHLYAPPAAGKWEACDNVLCVPVSACEISQENCKPILIKFFVN